MRSLPGVALLVLLASAVSNGPASAFTKDGCGSGECTDCHSLAKNEAVTLLGGLVDNVVSVQPSAVKGLWEVDVSKDGQKWPVYIDFSKKHLLNAQVIDVRTRESVTDARVSSLNRTDVTKIPIEGALVVGNPKAKRKVIVFSDPDCHFCGMLHAEMKKIVEKDRSVAFHIKLYSRANNPASTEKATAVICEKSLSLLEDAYAGRPVPPAKCTTTSPADTYKLAQSLKINGTPTMILPDGRVIRGYRDADTIRKLLNESQGTKPPAARRR